MSFINHNSSSRVYAPGYFLAHDECVRETKEIPQSIATTSADGGKYVPMGTIFPSNDANAEGIVYEDVNVTSGNMPGSVVTKGDVYLDRLPVDINATAASALKVAGFKLIEDSPSVTRS